MDIDDYSLFEKINDVEDYKKIEHKLTVCNKYNLFNLFCMSGNLKLAKYIYGHSNIYVSSCYYGRKNNKECKNKKVMKWLFNIGIINNRVSRINMNVIKKYVLFSNISKEFFWFVDVIDKYNFEEFTSKRIVGILYGITFFDFVGGVIELFGFSFLLKKSKKEFNTYGRYIHTDEKQVKYEIMKNKDTKMTPLMFSYEIEKECTKTFRLLISCKLNFTYDDRYVRRHGGILVGRFCPKRIFNVKVIKFLDNVRYNGCIKYPTKFNSYMYLRIKGTMKSIILTNFNVLFGLIFDMEIYLYNLRSQGNVYLMKVFRNTYFSNMILFVYTRKQIKSNFVFSMNNIQILRQHENEIYLTNLKALKRIIL
jgi:hypothetical protein